MKKLNKKQNELLKTKLKKVWFIFSAICTGLFIVLLVAMICVGCSGDSSANENADVKPLQRQTTQLHKNAINNASDLVVGGEYHFDGNLTTFFQTNNNVVLSCTFLCTEVNNVVSSVTPSPFLMKAKGFGCELMSTFLQTQEPNYYYQIGSCSFDFIYSGLQGTFLGSLDGYITEVERFDPTNLDGLNVTTLRNKYLQVYDNFNFAITPINNYAFDPYTIKINNFAIPYSIYFIRFYMVYDDDADINESIIWVNDHLYAYNSDPSISISGQFKFYYDDIFNYVFSDTLPINTRFTFSNDFLQSLVVHYYASTSFDSTFIEEHTPDSIYPISTDYFYISSVDGQTKNINLADTSIYHLTMRIEYKHYAWRKHISGNSAYMITFYPVIYIDDVPTDFTQILSNGLVETKVFTIVFPNLDNTFLENSTFFNAIFDTNVVINQNNVDNYNFFNVLTNGFNSIGGIFSIQILPGLTLGLLIFFPFLFSLILLLVSLIGGGK